MKATAATRNTKTHHSGRECAQNSAHRQRHTSAPRTPGRYLANGDWSAAQVIRAAHAGSLCTAPSGVAQSPRGGSECRIHRHVTQKLNEDTSRGIELVPLHTTKTTRTTTSSATTDTATRLT